MKLLQSDNLGVKSQFADRDPQLVGTLLLEALQAAEAWDEAFAHCRDLLLREQDGKSDTQDDGKIWALLITAAKASSDSK